jgi:hypothetical protein
MKLIRFTTADSPNPRFGVVIRRPSRSVRRVASQGREALATFGRQPILPCQPSRQRAGRKGIARLG